MSALFCLCLLASGCLYANVHVPRAYRSATPADVKASSQDTVVSGKACFRQLFFIVAWGDGGYAAAARKALKDHPGAILYDVKADAQATSVLAGLYARGCTVVTGRVGVP
jgi:hypothetical protein